MNNVLTTFCSDWSLGFGENGYNKVGILCLNTDTMRFTWKGCEKDRNGKVLKEGIEISWTKPPTVDRDYMPDITVLKKCMDRLLWDKKYPRKNRTLDRFETPE